MTFSSKKKRRNAGPISTGSEAADSKKPVEDAECVEEETENPEETEMENVPSEDTQNSEEIEKEVRVTDKDMQEEAR